MLVNWTKTVVGIAVTASFSVPLCALLSHRQLHDEPMAVLAGNLSVPGLIAGLMLLTTGIYNLAQLRSRHVCLLMQSTGIGASVTFKFAHFCLAVDQFVAVVFPLRHRRRMTQDLRWLVLATGITWTAIVSVLLGTDWIGLETVSEGSHSSANGTDSSQGCVWTEVTTKTGLRVVEVTMMTLSLVTIGLLITTGVVGLRSKARLKKRLRQQTPKTPTSRSRQRSFTNFKKFKVTCVVLSLTYFFDIVVVLLIHYDKAKKFANFLDQIRSVGFVIEGLAYGLRNNKIRTVYRKMFCINMARSSQENIIQHQQRGEEVQPQRQDMAVVNASQNETAQGPGLEMAARGLDPDMIAGDPDLDAGARDPQQNEGAPDAQDLEQHDDARDSDLDMAAQDSSQDMAVEDPGQDIAAGDIDKNNGARDPRQDMAAQDLELTETDRDPGSNEANQGLELDILAQRRRRAKTTYGAR